MASMVVTFELPTPSIGVIQERLSTPSICTVHAPHSAMQQPNFVPGHTEHVTRHPQRRRIAVDIDAVYVPIDFDGEGHGAISNQVDGNVDVAAGCFGVRTGLVRFGS